MASVPAVAQQAGAGRARPGRRAGAAQPRRRRRRRRRARAAPAAARGRAGRAGGGRGGRRRRTRRLPACGPARVHLCAALPQSVLCVDAGKAMRRRNSPSAAVNAMPHVRAARRGAARAGRTAARRGVGRPGGHAAAALGGGAARGCGVKRGARVSARGGRAGRHAARGARVAGGAPAPDSSPDMGPTHSACAVCKVRSDGCSVLMCSAD